MLSHPIALQTACRTTRRIVIAGLPDAASSWLTHAAVLLLAPDRRMPVWSGWVKDLPGGRFPVGHAVVRTLEYQSSLAQAADHVVFVTRDLRDALLTLHRTQNVKPDFVSASFLVKHAAQWEERANLIVNWEQIASEPRRALLALADALAIKVESPEKILAILQRGWDGNMKSGGRRFVGAGAYRTELTADCVALIERHFGRWLIDHGGVCESCSAIWAGVLPAQAPTARKQLLQRVHELAAGLTENENAREPACNVNPTAVAEFIQQVRQFGAPSYQLMAAELLRDFAPRSSTLIRAQAEIFPTTGNSDGSARHVSRLNIKPSGIAPVSAPEPSALKTARVSYDPVGCTPNQSSNTISRLAELVRGKTIGFLLHGSSVQTFASHAAALADEDVVWMGLNHFSILESRLLHPVEREMSLVFCCADGEVQRRLDDLSQFLARPGPRLLVTRPDHLAAFAERLDRHRNSIALELLPPLWPYPNSLELCLRLLVQSGPRRIVLFGADGYLGDDDAAIPTYFGADEFVKEKRYSGVLLDTLLFNAHMPRILAAWRARLGPESPEILNCSPGTLLKGFVNIDYTQAASALAGRPIKALPTSELPDPVLPAPTSENEADLMLIAGANAARRGDLVTARRNVLGALILAPSRLTPLANRIIQTEVRCMVAAKAALGLTGGDRPDAPEHWRWMDLARELRDANEAGPVDSWDQWE